MAKITSEEVTDAIELLRYVFDWQDDIYISVEVDGKLQPASFAEASSEDKARHLHRWLSEGIIPVRVLREVQDEVAETVNPE